MAGLLASMVLLSAAYLTFTLVYPFPPDIDSANLASGVENGWKLLGATLGIALAWWLDRQYVRFETKAIWWVQAIKFIVGLALVVALKAGAEGSAHRALRRQRRTRRSRAVFPRCAGGGVLWPMPSAHSAVSDSAARAERRRYVPNFNRGGRPRVSRRPSPNRRSSGISRRAASRISAT